MPTYLGSKESDKVRTDMSLLIISSCDWRNLQQQQLAAASYKFSSRGVVSWTVSSVTARCITICVVVSLFEFLTNIGIRLVGLVSNGIYIYIVFRLFLFYHCLFGFPIITILIYINPPECMMFPSHSCESLRSLQTIGRYPLSP